MKSEFNVGGTTKEDYAKSRKTHIVNVLPHIFKEIKIGDRVIINDEESKRCLILYVEEL